MEANPFTYLPAWKKPSVLPGFAPAMTFTLIYLVAVALIPLSGLFVQTAGMTWENFVSSAASDRALHAYKITFGLSFLAALVNGLFGFCVAWMLVRCDFPGKKLADAMVDLPFALPTAVAGVALSALYGPEGWIGRWLEPLGIKIAFAPPGILVALIFIGLPFVVRSVQPLLEELDKETEEAAASLGASPAKIFWKVIFPHVLPALTTGFAMAFARALGEYGSVIFIAGNIPGVSEIVPLLIVIKLEQYDYAGACAIASVMLTASFLLLLLIHFLQKWTKSRVIG